MAGTAGGEREATNVTDITGGVDTHADTHTVAAPDGLGRLLGHATFPAATSGIHQLWTWLSGHGTVIAVGMARASAGGGESRRSLRELGLAHDHGPEVLCGCSLAVELMSGVAAVLGIDVDDHVVTDRVTSPDTCPASFADP